MTQSLPAPGDVTRAFAFSLPTHIEFALGAAGRVAEFTATFGARPLVVTDPGVLGAGLVEPVLMSLRAPGMDPALFSEVEANPRVETVERAADLGLEHGADVIVAIGGGSAIDTAKGVSAVLASGGHVLDYEGWDAVPGPGTPIVAVPTTSGTGSEVTIWSVITDPARSCKTALGSVHIAPRVALVDPALTVTMPAHVTTTTGMDALTHAIEAYTARCSNVVSDALALRAMELATQHLERATEYPDDLEARSGMMLASLLAGIAFGNSDTAAVHSMAEALGGLLDVAHGLANAIFLPYVVAHNQPAAPDKTARIGLALGFHSGGLPVDEACAATVDGLFQMLQRYRIPGLIETGVTEQHLPALAALAQANLGTPDNPVEMNQESFRALFERALHGDGREGRAG